MVAMPRPPRPHREDVAIAALWLVVAVALWSFGLLRTFGGPRPGAVSLLPVVVMCAAECVRRTSPRAALLVGTCALVADLSVGSLLVNILMYGDLVYAAVVYGPERTARRVPPAAVLCTSAVTVGALVLLPVPSALSVGLLGALASVAPAYTGSVVRNHRDEAATERLRAEQTALLAEVDRTQAVNAERARMARELHDMVANHLSAIAIHSTAALSLEDDAEATRDALGVIRENSVQGLAELRRVIEILRDAAGEGPPDASPTLDGLDVLVERARTAAGPGFRFTLRDERGPEPVPAPVGMAAYRVVQEALTNALKHAAPGAVTVGVCRTEAGLRVEVTSPLDGTAHPGPRAPGSGAGLTGMRERVHLLGGRLRTGPVDGGTVWRVRAELPVTDRPAHAAGPGG
jgi:signal transduction histidine kinase